MCCGFCSTIAAIWPLLKTITAGHCTIILFGSECVCLRAYTHRLVLLADSSSSLLHPGVLQEMNYAAHPQPQWSGRSGANVDDRWLLVNTNNIC